MPEEELERISPMLVAYASVTLKQQCPTQMFY